MFPTFISATYRLSAQSHLHCTVLHSASDTVWYTEKPGAYVPHVFILRSVAVVINIAHLDILCDHVPDFNIDGFNVFSLTFWKATSKTFRALNSLHFSFALSRKCKSSIYYHNYFMSESPRRFFLQQPFTAYCAADVPVIRVVAKQARSDLNAYLAILETAVFPIKLPTYVRFIWAVRRHLRLTQ